MKHTQAPWKIGVVKYPKDDCFCVMANEGKIGIAMLGNVDIKTNEKAANAFLISAAPELLEACKSASIAIKGLLKMMAEVKHESFAWKPIYEELQRAIKKAEGGAK
jgi:hypothetical protein